MGEDRGVVLRGHGGTQGLRRRPGAGLRQRAADVGAGGKGLCAVGGMHREATRDGAVVVGRRWVEAQLRGGGQDQGRGIGKTGGGYVHPSAAAIGGVLPGALARRGAVARDGDAAKGRGRVAAAGDGGLVVGAIAEAQGRAQGADQGACAGGHILGGGQVAAVDGGSVIDVGHGGAQRHGVAVVAVTGGAAAGGDVGGGGAGNGAAAVIHQPHRQAARCAVEVVGRVEAQTIGAFQQQRGGGGHGGQINPSGTVSRILPLALRCNRAIGGDGNAGKGIGRSAASHGILGVGEAAAKQVGHRVAAAAVGVFRACSQDDAGCSARGRVVHAIDGDGDDTGGDKVVAGAVLIVVVTIASTRIVAIARQAARPRAGVALVVVGDGDVKAAVPVGLLGGIAAGVGDGERLQAGIDLRFGRAGDGDGLRARARHRTARAARGGDGALADGDGHRHGAGAVVVRVGDGDIAIGGIQHQRGGAFTDGDIAGRDIARIVDGRDEQVAGAAGNVIDAVGRNQRGVRVESVGAGYGRQVGLLVVGAAVGDGVSRHRESARTRITQPVIGNDFDLVGTVQIGGAQAGKSDLQAGQVGVDLGAGAAQFEGLGCSVECGVHRGAVTRCRGAERDTQVGVVLTAVGASCLRQGRSVRGDDPHRDLNHAIRLAIGVAVGGIYIIDHKAGNRRGTAAGNGHVAGACRYGGRIVDGGDGEAGGDVGNRIGHAAAADIAADSRAAFVEGQGEGDVAGAADTVHVVVDVAGAGVEKATVGVVSRVSHIAAIEQCLNILGAPGQCDGVRVVARDRHRLASRGGQAGGGAGYTDAQRAVPTGHRDGDRHGRAKGGGFGVLNDKLIAGITHLAAHVLIDGEAARAGEDGGVVHAGCAYIHRFGADVAGIGGDGDGSAPVICRAVHRIGRRVGCVGFVQLAAVGVDAGRNKGAAAITHAVIDDHFEFVERVAVVGKGDGEARQGGIDLGFGALELQDFCAAVLCDRHA